MTQLDAALSGRVALVDAVDHLLNRGAVLVGRSTISLAGVDLVYLELCLLLSSVETLEKHVDDARAAIPPLAAPDGKTDAPPGTAVSTAGSLPTLAPPRSVSPRAYELPEGRVLADAVSSNILGDRGTDAAEERPERSVAQLVLTLVELLRQIVERQAVRRLEGGRLSEDQAERMGVALMELAAKVEEVRAAFGLTKEDVNLDLGPLGRLLE